MSNAVLLFIIFQILLYVAIIGIAVYFINKWMTNYLAARREQNELLRNLVKTGNKK